MKPLKMLCAVGLFAAISLACNINIQIPRSSITTGPTVTETIEVSPRGTGTTQVNLHFGAGKLSLSPGNSSELVAGIAIYNVAALKPIVEQSENRVTIRQESLNLDGIPNINDYTNEWNLQLGPSPMTLEINAGAYEGIFDLGGLALEELRVLDGASSSQFTFSQPNQAVMESLVYETGASQVSLRMLGNANLTRLTFSGGVGDYLLDFSGDLMQDADITIDAGLSEVTIIVPEGTNARVNVTGGLAATTTSGAWRQAGDGYTLSGTGSTLLFDIEIGAGSLDLRTTE
jgi:hypothetical protein